MTRGGSCGSWLVRSPWCGRACARVRQISVRSSLRSSCSACAFVGAGSGAGGQGRGDAHQAGRLCASRHQAAAAGRGGGADLRLDRGRASSFVRSTSTSTSCGRARRTIVGSARTDPDGSAIRLALARKATPNVMVAGERLFIDLLPDTWSGSAAVAAGGCHQGIGRAGEGGRAAAAAAGCRARRKEAAADSRARVHAADLHALCVRTAGRRRRLDDPEQGTPDAEFRFRPVVRSCRCEGRVRAEHHLDRPEDRRRKHGGRVLR